MKTELIALLLKRVKVPKATRDGLIIAVVIFKTFDIEGRVKRAMAPK